MSKNVKSKRNNPSEDTSAMDGFAINSKNSTNKFKIIGESSAGNPFKGKVGKNETVQIFTGSFLPKGTNTVIIQENTKNLTPEIITNTVTFEKNQNVRKKGVDLKLGELVVKKNTVIFADNVGLFKEDMTEYFKHVRDSSFYNSNNIGSHLEYRENIYDAVEISVRIRD